MTARALISMTVAIVASLGLSACSITTANEQVANVSESREFQAVCQIAPLAHNAFVILATESGKVSERVIQQEAQAYAVVDTVCKNPPADIVEALATVVSAYNAILAAQANNAANVERAI